MTADLISRHSTRWGSLARGPAPQSAPRSRAIHPSIMTTRLNAASALRGVGIGNSNVLAFSPRRFT